MPGGGEDNLNAIALADGFGSLALCETIWAKSLNQLPRNGDTSHDHPSFYTACLQGPLQGVFPESVAPSDGKPSAESVAVLAQKKRGSPLKKRL